VRVTQNVSHFSDFLLVAAPLGSLCQSEQFIEARHTSRSPFQMLRIAFDPISVRGELLGGIDDDHFNLSLTRPQLQAKLFLESSKY
jgi:hypothetical protein